MRVLVIDDNEDVAFLLCELVRQCGCESRFCLLPEQAVEIAEQWQANVILLDLAMPGVDGYHLAPKLRAASNGTVPRILAVSGYRPDPERMAAATIDGHMLKPVRLEKLKELLPC
jgi:two-component system CheB/CheR fusion protein